MQGIPAAKYLIVPVGDGGEDVHGPIGLNGLTKEVSLATLDGDVGLVKLGVPELSFSRRGHHQSPSPLVVSFDTELIVGLRVVERPPAVQGVEVRIPKELPRVSIALNPPDDHVVDPDLSRNSPHGDQEPRICIRGGRREDLPHPALSGADANVLPQAIDLAGLIGVLAPDGDRALVSAVDIEEHGIGYPRNKRYWLTDQDRMPRSWGNRPVKLAGEVEGGSVIGILKRPASGSIKGAVPDEATRVLVAFRWRFVGDLLEVNKRHHARTRVFSHSIDEPSAVMSPIRTQSERLECDWYGRPVDLHMFPEANLLVVYVQHAYPYIHWLVSVEHL